MARRPSMQALANRITRSFRMRPVEVIETECRKCHGGGWAARFDPKRRKIHLGTKNLDRKFKRALLGHELGHAVADELVCRRPRRLGRLRRLSRCRYVGQHDRKMMFPIVERIHRRLRTDPHTARELERLSGYDPGPSFMRPRRRMGFRARRLARRFARRMRR